MGLAIKTAKNLPIGVDLGSSFLKIVQLRSSDGRVELVGAGLAEAPAACRDDRARWLDFHCQQIRGLLKAGRFKGRETILALPASATFLQPVRIPILPEREIDSAIKTELRGKLPYPVEDAVIRHILAGTVYQDGRDMQERIVVATARPDLEECLLMAHRAGLDVVGVDVEACAIVECFARMLRRSSDQASGTLFVDMGASSTQVVLTQSHKMVFASNLPLGGRSLDDTIAERLGISSEQARCLRRQAAGENDDRAAEDELFGLLDDSIAELADRIIQCVRYYESVFRNQAIGRVIFLGGQAHSKRLCQSIARRLNLPAQVGDPMAGIKRASNAAWDIGLDARQPNPSWAVAVGLSLGATLAA